VPCALVSLRLGADRPRRRCSSAVPPPRTSFAAKRVRRRSGPGRTATHSRTRREVRVFPLARSDLHAVPLSPLNGERRLSQQRGSYSVRTEL